MSGGTESRYPRSALLSPELAGAGGLLIAGAVVAALVVHYQSHSGAAGGLVGDYRATPASTAAGTSGAWTTDGPFAVRVDRLSCAATAVASAKAPSPLPSTVDCTLRAEVRTDSAVPLRYLPPTLRAGNGTALTALAGSAGVDVAPGRTVGLVYRFRADTDQANSPPSRLLLGNGAPTDALSVRRR